MCVTRSLLSSFSPAAVSPPCAAPFFVLTLFRLASSLSSVCLPVSLSLCPAFSPWTTKPLQFDNEYFVNLLHRTWKLREWDGPLQFEDEESGTLMMLPSDLARTNYTHT
jgi:hypothetical protein